MARSTRNTDYLSTPTIARPYSPSGVDERTSKTMIGTVTDIKYLSAKEHQDSWV